MLNKATTSTGMLLIGLSTLAGASSTPTLEELNLTPESLYAIELKHNSPESVKTRVDSYVDLAYKMDDNLSNKYSFVDYGFVNSVQKFAKVQVELDPEFSQALDELFQSKVNSKPSKKRF
jgi:hypothetical protein